jgi:glycolate oxidase iron-sulfur subunit
LALKNLKVFAEADVDVIVTDCSSCASFLKEYKKVFSDEPEHLALVEKIRPLLKDVV